MQITYPSKTIARAVIPRSAVNTAVLMVGFALLTALAAQIQFNVPGTPVPITGQTFAVLLAGAALGSRAGAGSQAIYWVMGAIGLPFYANADSGWSVATGATGGYLIGFIVAAWVVGSLAERGQDRAVSSAIPAFLTGNAIVYIIGIPWLMASVPSIETMVGALAAGFTPFVIGDLIKVVLAGVLLPTAWKIVDRTRSDNP
jgi:biotin transport system substrate-specific component